MNTQTHKEKQCADCPQIFPVRNQHFTRITRCLLCQSKFDRKRRSEHQREVRKAKKNKISANTGAGALPVKNEVNGDTSAELERPLL